MRRLLLITLLALGSLAWFDRAQALTIGGPGFYVDLPVYAAVPPPVVVAPPPPVVVAPPPVVMAPPPVVAVPPPVVLAPPPPPYWGPHRHWGWRGYYPHRYWR